MSIRLHRRIIADPEILGGKPIVDGTRLSVAYILGLLSRGMSVDEMIEAYPILEREDILNVIGYAAKALENDIYIEAD